MPNVVKLKKVKEEQWYGIVAVVDEWAENPRLRGLIEVTVILSDCDTDDLCQVNLKVSGEVDYPLWQRFCREIEMNVPYPNW